MDAVFGAASTAVAVGVAGHLWAEARGWSRARAALKALASLGFLAAAGVRLAPDRYGLLVLTGLSLSAVGDLCLLGRRRPAFLAGIGAFLLAHVAYAAAFAPGARGSPAVAAALGALALLLVRWLWPHLGPLRGPVLVYAAAISVMAFFGLGAPALPVRLGAALFYVSDLTVARDRFVAAGLANRLVGIPLYYAAQLLFAFTVGDP